MSMYLSENPYIQSFYDSDFKKIFSKKRFRAFLRNSGRYAADTMNIYWYKNDDHQYYYEEMSEELIFLYELRLGDLYKQFEDRVDQLFNNCIHSQQAAQTKEGAYDYVLLNNLRISRQKDSIYPQYFLRRDGVNPCMDLCDEWVEVEGSEATKAKILDINLDRKSDNINKKEEFFISAYLSPTKQGEDDLLHHVFKLATHTLFRSKYPDHNYVLGKANVDWAKLRLSGLLTKDCEFIKEDKHNKSTTESIRFSHVAGLLGYIYSRKHKAKTFEQTDAFKLKLESIYPLLFDVRDFDYLEDVLQKGSKQYQKIMFLEFIKQNLGELQFWEKESSNKAYYAVYFNYDRNNNSLSRIPRDYFSYENMVAKNGNKDLWTENRFLFPNKKSMKNAFKMNVSAFSVLFPDGGCRALYQKNASKLQAQIDENAWRILTHWIGSVDHPETIDHDEIKKIRVNVEKLFVGQISKKTVEKFPIAVNLIYQLIRAQNPKNEDMGAKLSDILDYVEGSELVFMQNNLVVKTRKKNIHSFDTKTTLKSLERKSHHWHKILELYNQCELLRRGENYKKNVYDNLAELSFVEDNVNFTVLQNRYELLMEGVDMRHCVATYHAKIMKGIYAVMSLKRPNPQSESGYDRATLGLNLNGGVISLDQCKGIYNAMISPELRAVVDRVIEKLNNKSYLLFHEDTPPIRIAAV